MTATNTQPIERKPDLVSMDPLQMLTAAEVAWLLGVNKRTVWRMVALGDLPKPVRLSERVVRWRRGDLAKFLEGLR